MITSDLSAPAAPGRLGAPLETAPAAAYLDALGRWRDARRRELDELDAAALGSANPAGLTGDLTLAMAVWKATSDRYERLLAVWDSGRVQLRELTELATLVWGRLDGLSVSLPEGCRLLDALVAQLRVRLGLEPSSAEVTARVRALRAQLERIRDQTGLEPAGAQQQQAAERSAKLARRLTEAADKAARGGDVAGLLAPLEIEAATFERDLIVGGARRREAAGLLAEARAQRTRLETREAALRELVERCVQTVEPAPHYAVPDVDALGPTPGTPDLLGPYLRRLAQVDRALSMASTAYTDALAAQLELAGRLEAYHAKAVATGVADTAEVARAYAMAAEVLAQRPCRMPLATQLVSLYQTYLQGASAPPSPGEERAR